MADRTLTCSRCSKTFIQVGRGRTATACPDCRSGCSVNGCDRPHKTAGFCKPHYARWKRGADLSMPIGPYERGERICKLDGCNRKRAGSATYCVMHNSRVKDRGEPGPVEPKIAAPGHAIWNTPNVRRQVAHLWKFGLTPEKFAEILAEQGGRCKICKTDDPRNNRVSTWAIDHDHACCPGPRSCGKCLRGLLCGNCNRGLGLFGDSLPVVESAAVYLRHYAKE